MSSLDAIENRARRAAKRAGLIAEKSRRKHNNLGGFRLVDAQQRFTVAGHRFELSGEDILSFLGEEALLPR